MKRILLLIVSALFWFNVQAQADFKNVFDQDEMDMKSYNKDTSAHALVLKEFGKAYISSDEKMMLVYQYHVRIKIFDSKTFDKGDVYIRLHHGDDELFETVRDIKGITYSKDAQGNIAKTELNSKQIYSEMRDKHHEVVKFAMPNISNGCVIDYSYTTESPYRFNFHTWVFQWDIPKLYSEYEAHIPAIYDYNTSLRGGLKLSKNDTELERECFSLYGVKADCTKINYVMKDVPAFVEESHMTSPNNYISAIYYELAARTDQNGVKLKITQDWKDIDRTLKQSDYFGSQMKRKDLFKDRLSVAMLSINDTLMKAKAVYSYIQKWYKWNNTYGMESNDGIKKAFDGHSGSVGDINLSLVAALSAAGIATEAVVLSTRENGLINKLYPVMSDFNYVVVRVNINNKYYLLDATDPLLSFGMLPLRCINDQGRVMSLNRPSYWIDMVQTQKEAITTALDLTLQPDGKIKGIIVIYSAGYAAYEKRRAIKRFNSVDEYVENLDEKLTKLKISKSEISNLDSLENSVIEKYDVIIDAYKSLDKDGFSFDPAFWVRIKENPFKLSERSYPVDLGSIYDAKLILTLHYPEGFNISSQPVPVGIALPYQGGLFITNVAVENNVVQYSQIEQLKKAIYAPEEYPYLKELYNKIIQNQKATFVFNKKP